ncbi:phospholipase A [Colwellia echini]|uniref:Phospholipase A1 n=1 Tax=Colwellia echini TaxID=1982103 RepID=A0ABY3MU29_9GAMM|nr:phospholipase A [Colwellia echini]TYK64694.1 phospholipase A [Colwellia echini]
MNNNVFSSSFLTFLLYFVVNIPVNAADSKTSVETEYPSADKFDKCIIKTIKSADKKTSLAEIESLCEQKIAREILHENNEQPIELGALSNRIIKEKHSEDNPYVLTPYKMNYILPFTVVNTVNRNAYKDFSTWEDDLKNVEAQFQISVKIPLLTGDLFREGDQIFFGFTLQSWWQIYAKEISKPFRETNYQPEFFYLTPINLHPFGGNSALVLGLEHQSNGQSQLLSRSWNRAYATYLYEKRDFALAFRAWWRIPESEKSPPVNGVIDGDGDDNPDIIDYMGYFELGMVYKQSINFEYYSKIRNNFSTHNGFIEIGATFPLWGKLKGYTQLSSGYGGSLIDYNINQTRFGIGIALTTLL